MMGRYRKLTDLVRNKVPSKRQHGLRAAINTPIQGSAADIVTAAMVRVFYNQRLKDLGWKMLLQIHDEIILEGPKETAQEALAIVKDLMAHPLDDPLRIVLEVDAKIAENWYDAK
jgi:DNA polymerase I - 3''-5'' exonuclease and polymerase domains